METIVKKWGNSLGIKIPDLIARELSLKEDTLSEMLTRIKEENIHGEITTNGPIGNEIW
jgi:antitoxin MazE